ncbi:MAG: MOSC N-terminal beta barrel domain-containing protein [Chloroflexota bacterium]
MTITEAPAAVANVTGLWRYPVKSMQGEELNAVEVSERGVVGDRAYALLDRETGKVASAKNPRKWGRLFDFRAAYLEPPRAGAPLPPVRITLPDGSVTTSADANVNAIVSKAIVRDVTLASTSADAPVLEEYWPDIEGLARRDEITDEPMPERTFFDAAVVHILTTATLDRLRSLYVEGRFEVHRFRPNIVVTPDAKETGFVEDAWVGRTLVIGETRITVLKPCPRCVMTTLPQGDLPRDGGILRTAAKHHEVNVGVYCGVARGGTIRRGDTLRIE